MARHRLKARREELGIKQEELAHLLGTDRSVYGRWERGETRPSLRWRRPLAQHLDVSLERLDQLLVDVPEIAPVGGLPPTVGLDWRIAPDTAADLEALVVSYRRAYGAAAPAAELLPAATSLLHILGQFSRADHWSGEPRRLVSLIGQLNTLVGLLQLMAHRAFDTARSHYDLALQAAYEAQDWDLAAYVLGSLAFEAISSGRDVEAQSLRVAATDLANRRAAPRTRSWVAALGSELAARAGDAGASHRLLEHAHGAMRRADEDPDWKGIGWFDSPRLHAYGGGNLLILGRYRAAEEVLRRSIDDLDSRRLKHRCTLTADRALALAHVGEIDEACTDASTALTIATTLGHQESLQRVRTAHRHLVAVASGTQPVAALTDRLRIVESSG